MCCRDAAKLHARYTDEIQKLRIVLKQKDAEIAVLRDEKSCQRNEVLQLQHAAGEHVRQLAKLEKEVSAAHMHLDETIRCAISCVWAACIQLHVLGTGPQLSSSCEYHILFH